MNCEYCRNNLKLEKGVHGGCVKCGAPIKDMVEVESLMQWKILSLQMQMQSDVMRSMIKGSDPYEREKYARSLLDQVDRGSLSMGEAVERVKNPVGHFFSQLINDPLNIFSK